LAYEPTTIRPDDNNWGTSTPDRSTTSTQLPHCRRRHHRWRDVEGVIIDGAMSKASSSMARCRRRHHRWRDVEGVIIDGAMSKASRHDESFSPPISALERL